MSRTARAKVRVVTGIVDIPDHPRSRVEYDKYFTQLRGALGDYTPMVFEAGIRDLWMTSFIEGLVRQGHYIRHSEGDNSKKNSTEYHVVQHQKPEWLEMAALRDPDADVFVWMDYGIARLPGVAGEVLTAFLRRVRNDNVTIPGCWDKREIDDSFPCWRFCGSMFIVPRRDVFAFNKTFKAITRIRVRSTCNISWETNDMAHLELANVGPYIKWYPGDHNASMFVNYA